MKPTTIWAKITARLEPLMPALATRLEPLRAALATRLAPLMATLTARLETMLAGVPPRQRPLLFIGLGLSSLLLVWLLLLAPLSFSRAALRREIGSKEQELLWMQEAALEIRQYLVSEGGGGKNSLPLAAIDRTARQLGLGHAMQRVEPAGGREVRVWLENAAFDEMLRWLALLKAEHGIAVTEIVVEPGQSGSGLVSSRLTLIKN